MLWDGVTTETVPRRACIGSPPSGSGVEAVTGQRVECPDWRKEASDESGELLPTEACRLTAPLERGKPEPLQFVEEPPQARVVARDCEVVQMPFQHLLHPSTGFRDGVVHLSAQLYLDMPVRLSERGALNRRGAAMSCSRFCLVSI